MSYIYYNPNPDQDDIDVDCTIRGISKLFNLTWDEAYIMSAVAGYIYKKMPVSNKCWPRLLDDLGLVRREVPNTCPNCITVKDFAGMHPRGRFLVGTGSHVVAIVNGDYYDSWDSGDETPIYYWEYQGG